MKTLMCLWGITWEYLSSLQSSLLWIRETIARENGNEVVKTALLDPKNDVSLSAHLRMRLLIVLSITNQMELPNSMAQSFSQCVLYLTYQQLLFGRERFIVSVLLIFFISFLDQN